MYMIPRNIKTKAKYKGLGIIELAIVGISIFIGLGIAILLYKLINISFVLMAVIVAIFGGIPFFLLAETGNNRSMLKEIMLRKKFDRSVKVYVYKFRGLGVAHK